MKTPPKKPLKKTNPVILRMCGSEYEAEADKSLLESYGIKSFISKDDCGGMRPYLQMTTGVKLIVREEDVGKANRILSENKS